ncbi:GH25 family lysozyme [Streptomyces sp. NPDC058257]|uniref:GH25 family lysozyme n=1 Tax=Streptomyces sp. NPDC058257 TaxID=3346409 RepID=UPI0036E81118
MRHGGRWSAVGLTLPSALGIEHNPYGERKRHGVGERGVVHWIKPFSDEVTRQTGRRPVICTTARWWNKRTGGSRAFAAHHALWLARWSSASGSLPRGWSYLTFRQHDNGGRLPGDQNLFNGSTIPLKRSAPRVATHCRTPSEARIPGLWRLTFQASRRHSGRSSSGPRQNRIGSAPNWVTARPDPVHFPFTQLAYVPLATDVQQKPG